MMATGTTASAEHPHGTRPSGLRLRLDGGDWRLLLATIPLLVGALLYQPLSELGLRAGSITIEPIDLPLLIALGVGLPEAIRRRHSYWRTPETAAFIGIALVFLAPVFIGLAAGNDWQSVFRDARLFVAYISFFAILPLINDRRQITLLLWVVFWLVVVAAGFGAVAWVAGMEWASGMSVVPTKKGDLSRGFGWWSAMPWYPLGVVIGMAFVAMTDRALLRRASVLALSAFLLGSSLATLVRSQLVGVVFGAVCVLVLTVLLRRDLGWRRLLLRGTAIVAVLAAAGAGFAWLLSPPSFEVLGERTASIVSSTASSSGASTNRDLRLVAIAGSAEFAVSHPFGAGYGRPAEGVGMQDYVQSYWSSHSGLAWPLFRLGWPGFALAAAAAVVLLISVFRGLGRRASGLAWCPTATLGCVVALLGESVGASYPFAQMYTYPLVPLLLAMSVADMRGHPGAQGRGALLLAGRVSAVSAAVVGLLAVVTAAVAAADTDNRLVRTVVGPPSATLAVDRTAPGPYEAVGKLPWDYAPATPRYWVMRDAGPVGNFVWLTAAGCYEVSAVIWGGTNANEMPHVQLTVDGTAVGASRDVSSTFWIERWSVELGPGRHFVGFEMRTAWPEDPWLAIADPQVAACGSAPAPSVVVVGSPCSCGQRACRRTTAPPLGRGDAPARLHSSTAVGLPGLSRLCLRIAKKPRTYSSVLGGMGSCIGLTPCAARDTG